MMIVGRKFDEATVLNVAFAHERLTHWSFIELLDFALIGVDLWEAD